MEWLCGGSNRRDPLGDSFDLLLGRRVDPFVVQHGSSGIVDTAGSDVKVSVEDVLSRFRLEHWNREDKDHSIDHPQERSSNSPKKFTLFFNSVMEMLDAPVGIVATLWYPLDRFVCWKIPATGLQIRAPHRTAPLFM